MKQLITAIFMSVNLNTVFGFPTLQTVKVPIRELKPWEKRR